MMHLAIITPDKKVFEGSVQQVSFPGSVGTFQVLKNHAPLVSTLQKGAISYSNNQQNYTLPIEGGIVEVSHNAITVLVNSEAKP